MLADGAAPSDGTVGDASENALAESVIGLYETEVICRQKPSRNFEDVEHATLKYLAWFNAQRLLEPPGSLQPAELEEHYARAHAAQAELLAVD